MECRIELHNFLTTVVLPPQLMLCEQEDLHTHAHKIWSSSYPLIITTRTLAAMFLPNI